MNFLSRFTVIFIVYQSLMAVVAANYAADYLRGMVKVAPIHDALLDQTIAMVAEVGLEQISLRTIAAQAGCTTAVIFQQYQGKAGLISASLERALARDMNAHEALFAQIDGLLASHSTLSDFMAGYVALRARQDVARFWSEMLFKSKQIAEGTPHLVRWHAMRVGFWRRVLAETPDGETLAAMIAGYTAMEEVYAYPLVDDPQYQLLMRETTRALTRAAFDPDVPEDRHTSVSAILDKAPLPSISQDTTAFVMREQLLGYAIQAIVEDGIGTVNQRSLAEKASVSSSMISYHFKDMKSFVNEAVWRALVHGIPRELDPSHDAAEMPGSLDEWFAMLDAHIRPRAGDMPAGFYTGFARITGQACLLADTRSSLMPLVQHLRGLEGWGTYRVSRTIDPSDRTLTRDRAAAFGMWIKAEAVLREAGLSDAGVAGIARVAKGIFATTP
jgi:AcrR family transcriptional regulator